MDRFFKTLLLTVLVSGCVSLVQAEAKAQGAQYDLSWMDSRVSVNRSNSAVRVSTNQFDLSSLGTQQGTMANVSRPTSTQSLTYRTNRRVPLLAVQSATLAQNSVDMSAVPSGKFDYGFPKVGAKIYRGLYAQNRLPIGSSLPQVSTSSLDINICDESPNNGIGGPGGGTEGPGGPGGPQGPPALPPGWAGVMCHGIYAGAIPPGGTVEAFWRGEYGFAGDAAQQAALLEEGKWLLAHGQIGP
jgi:hypothetical protein